MPVGPALKRPTTGPIRKRRSKSERIALRDALRPPRKAGRTASFLKGAPGRYGVTIP